MSLGNNISSSNIRVIGLVDGQKGENEAENVEEIMARSTLMSAKRKD